MTGASQDGCRERPFHDDDLASERPGDKCQTLYILETCFGPHANTDMVQCAGAVPLGMGAGPQRQGSSC